MTIQYLFSVLFVFTQFCLFGQSSIEPLKSKGEIPLDFSNYTIEKINAGEHNHSEEFQKLSKRQQKHFLKSVHQGIDEILRSGKVLFGDTLTKYLNAVGKKILGDDPKLKHIRFYTLRSNVVNAFSTNQGIIFVSEGLMAHVKNEAQLAFVLAHELAHYIQKHVIVGFRENMELMISSKSMSEKIKRYSIYSRDKEYEADRVGVQIYNRAGYKLVDLFTVFDLLTYSYLPFDSKPVPLNYFNNSKMYLPPSFFKNDLPKILPDENGDDSKSTHPNIKSRRDQLSGEIQKYKTWENNEFLTSNEAFEFARSVAQLEIVRNNLYDFEFIEALYNLFLLEEKFADNIHFNHYKAQTWLGLLIFKSQNRFSDISAVLKDIQGEQHQMHHVIRALNRRQLGTLALRNIYDLKKRFPEDQLIVSVYDKLVELLAADERFRLSEFYDISLKELLDKTDIQNSNNSGTALSASQIASERAKYGMKSDGQIDDNEFYRFGIPDIIQDTEFQKTFELKKKELRENQDLISELHKKSKSTGKKASPNKSKPQRLALGIQKLILLEPRALATRNYRNDVIASEELEIKIKEAFEKLEVDFMQVVKIGSKELKNANAEIYNENAILKNTLNQLLEYRDLPLFPVDYYELDALRKKYKTDKVAFLVIENDHEPWKSKLAFATQVTLIPWLAFQVHKSAEQFVFSMIVFDLKKYSIDGLMRYSIHGKPSAAAIDAICLNMLKKLNQTPPSL